MSRNVGAGRTKFFLWGEPNTPFIGSLLDVGTTTVFEFGSGGQVLSARSGRADSFNSLKNLRRWYAYQATPSTAITLPLSTLGVGTAPGGTPPLGERVSLPLNSTLRVYKMGNSVLDTHKYTGLVAFAQYASYTHTWGRHMLPGSPLSFLLENPTNGFSQAPFGFHQQALGNYDWDVLVLQPFDRQVQDDRTAINTLLQMQRTRGANPRPMIYVGWPSRTDVITPGVLTAASWRSAWTSGPTAYRRKDFYEQLVQAIRTDNPGNPKAYLIPIAHVMTALNDIWEVTPAAGGQLTSAWSLFHDDIHLNNIGAYICGVTMMASLYSRDPRGLPVPSEYYAIETYDIPITNALRQQIQTAVWNVVNTDPFTQVSETIGQIPDSGDPGNTSGTGTPNQLPTATFNATPGTGRTINFTSTGSSDPDGFVLGYDWKFGDGNTSNQVAPSHTFAADGNYVTTLRVMDNRGGYSSTVGRIITIGSAPQVGVGTTSINYPEGFFAASQGWSVYKDSGDPVGLWELFTSDGYVATPSYNGLAVSSIGLSQGIAYATNGSKAINLKAHIVLPDATSGVTPALYGEGLGIALKSPTATDSGNTAGSYGGSNRWSPSINFGFRWSDGRITANFLGQPWAEIWNPTIDFAPLFAGGAAATSGIHIWIDIAATTHQCRIFMSNSSTKPASPITTQSLADLSGQTASAYLGGNVTLALGGRSVFINDFSAQNKRQVFKSVRLDVV